jgi:hypothetical protein
MGSRSEGDEKSLLDKERRQRMMCCGGDRITSAAPLVTYIVKVQEVYRSVNAAKEVVMVQEFIIRLGSFLSNKQVLKFFSPG